MSAAQARRFAGKVAWVVGASGGLGGVIALRLAAEGARVALSGRKVDVLEQVASRIRDAGGAAPLVLPLDVTSTPSVDEAAQRVVAQAGGIDHLVNSTTAPVWGTVLELADADWIKVLDSKLIGYARTIRAALPHLLARGGGAIVNISGRGGRQPRPEHLAGGGANAAVNLLSKGLADQYWREGIRVNALAPGRIESPRVRQHDALSGAAGDTIPPGLPEDVAAGVAFLLSDDARYVNGTVLAVDGASLATV